MIAVKTKSGYVTSYREVWKAPNGRSVWSWRVDEGQPPHDFGSAEAAQKWIDDVWHSSTRKERDEAGWTVEIVEQVNA